MAAETEHQPSRVFLSYARADQPKVAKLTAALEARSVAVWWDRALEGGSAFADVIEAELKRSDACIVAWSKASVASHWVRDEAGWARDHGRLVPVLLDSSEPPLGFRQFQAVDFSHWSGRPDAPEVDALMAALGQAAPVAARPAKRRLPMPWLAGLAAMLVAGLGVLGWRQVAGPEAAAPSGLARPAQAASVAVLPFADLSEARDQAYFADGVAEEITMRLSRDGRLKVIGRSTAAAIRDRASDLDYLRDKLGVAHLLEGSVREAGGRLRIAVRLIDTKDGSQRWAETYDRQAGDIFAVQDEVAGAVVRRLSANLASPGAAATGASANHSTSPENYRTYLLARSLMRERTVPSANRAAALFAEVMKADPDFAPAFAAFAYATGLRHHYGEIGLAEYRRLAPPAAERALELDPTLAEAWLGKGQLSFKTGDGAAAAEAARRAVALDPDNPEVLGPASNMIGLSGLPGSKGEQYQLLQRAVQIDPLFIQTQLNLQGSGAAVGDEATARRALAAFDKIATRREDVDRLRLTHYYEYRAPADFIRLYRAMKTGAGLEWEANLYRNRLAALFDRAGLEAATRERDAWFHFAVGDWAGVLRALDGPERNDLPRSEQVFLAAVAFPSLGRSADLVSFVASRHPLPWPPARHQWGVRAALALAQAHRKAGNQAAAAPYIAYARANLARMRADAFSKGALAQAEAELALADGDRAAALRHLEYSATEPTDFNICYGPEWIGTSPAWEDLRPEPGFKRLVETCRALVNSQRAEIGLPPAKLP